jgi:hypothetical protein
VGIASAKAFGEKGNKTQETRRRIKMLFTVLFIGGPLFHSAFGPILK